MEPKRSIAGSVVRFVLAAIVVAFLVNVSSNRLDAYWVLQYGEDYPKQFFVVLLGSPYVGYVIAMFSVIALYYWSQQAPAPERIVESTVEYRERPPATGTKWKELWWCLVGNNATAYCPTHRQVPLLFQDAAGTHESFRAMLGGDRNALFCGAGEGHYVALGETAEPTINEFQAAARVAKQRLRSGIE